MKLRESMQYQSFITVVTAVLLSVCTTSLYAMSDEEIDELFNKGLEESEIGDLGKSIEHFEAILNERPGLNRVKIELALSNFRALNYAVARRLAEEVLNDPGTPESVKVTIRSFLAELEKQSKPHLFTPYLSAGFLYDSNINVGPGTNSIDVAGGTLDFGTAGSNISSGGVQINSGLGHRYLFPKSYELLGTTAALAWESQASLFRNEYFDDDDDFDLNVITFRTGPALLSARNWRASAKFEANHISVGNDSIAWYLGFNPAITWFINGRTSITTDFLIQDRDFFKSRDKDRDATYLSAAVTIGHNFKGAAKPSIYAGVRYFDEDADTDRRSNDGYRASVGFNVQPSSKSKAYINYSYRQRDYDDVEPVFGIARDESEKRFSLGANYRFKTGNLMDDVLLSLDYSNTSNDSNVALFSFNRYVTVLSLSRSF